MLVPLIESKHSEGTSTTKDGYGGKNLQQEFQRKKEDCFLYNI